MKRGRAVSAHLRAGFTLLESVISFALLTVFAGSLLLVLSLGTRAAGTAMACQDLEGKARRTVERMENELAGAGASVLVPDPTAPFGSTSLAFQRVDGIDEELAVHWGTPVRIALRPESGESDDGMDNDGDGLVDEQELLWTSDPGGDGERSVVWVHGVRPYLEGEEANGRDDNGNGLVDERGLSFVRQGGHLTIALTLMACDRKGDPIVRSARTTLDLEN